MFVTRRSKNSLFYVFDSFSNLDCGQWYKFWIWQSSNEFPGDTKCWNHGEERLFCMVTSVSIHSFVEWLDTFSYALRPAEVTVKEVSHIRRFAHPSLEKISGIVRHYWKEIQKSETLTKLFPEPLVVAFRRPKSPKDTLVRTAVSRPSSTVGQGKPCGDKRCKCCLHLQHAQVFHSKTTGKEYKIFCNVNRKTGYCWHVRQIHQALYRYVSTSCQCHL
jgi:hypothetical protein